jgi:type VI secretion system secreted protein Hcp
LAPCGPVFRISFQARVTANGHTAENFPKISNPSKSRLQACRPIGGSDVGLHKEIVMPIYMRLFENGVRAVVDGEVTAKGHEKWIELSSLQLGLSTTLGSDVLGYPPIKSEAAITKSQDSTSMQLFNRSINSPPLTVDVHFVKPGETEPYLSFSLQNTEISSFGIASGTSEERLTLAFSKITYNTHEASPDVSRHSKVIMNRSTGKRGAHRKR